MNATSGQQWIKGRVSGRRRWTDALFSFQVDVAPADQLDFEAGQFIKLGLPLNGEMVGRPFSFVNAPQSRPYEFYGVTVPGGPLSSHLAALESGDDIYLASRPSGFLVLSEVPDGDSLWLICTGTGIGPFLSILGTDTVWRRFRQVVLVHGTRHMSEQTYREVINTVGAAHPDGFRLVSLLSGDPVAGDECLLAGRIPQAIRDGRLERAAGVPLVPGSAQVMLCGNPAMVADASTVLLERGLKKNRRRTPGHITVENYW